MTNNPDPADRCPWCDGKGRKATGPSGFVVTCEQCDGAGQRVLRMPDADAEAILAILSAVSAAEPTTLVSEGWRRTWCGNVTWSFRGWTITVFNDCGDWDYIDSVEAPDGRRWDYDDMTDPVRFWSPDDEAGWPSLEHQR